MATTSGKNETGFPKLDGLPVDICIFTVATEHRSVPRENVDKRTLKSYPNRYLSLVLVQRRGEPFQHKWALPGGFTHLESESLDEAARRELKEETNLNTVITGDTRESGIYLEQMRAYYRPNRDPRGHIPTVAFVALVNEDLISGLRAGGDAGQAQLFRVRMGNQEDVMLESADGKITITESDLAFDHADIIRDALRFVQHKMMTTLVAATLLPEEFTIAELHKVISSVVPTYTPTTNFTRDLVKTKSRDGLLEEVVEETGEPKKSSRYSARPAQLYRFRKDFEARVSVYPRV